MRTTVDIPEELLESARQAARVRTKREAVVAGLEELVRKSRREELRRLAGQLDLNVDLSRSRRRPRRTR